MSLEQITIRIAHGGVVFHRIGRWSRNGVPYLIARTTDGATIKGEMSDAVEGDQYRLWGEWREQKRSEYGTAFEFQHYESIIGEAPAAVAKFLSRHIAGVGSRNAQRIVDHFGADALGVLRAAPERIAECTGVSPTVVAHIKDYFSDQTIFDPTAYTRLLELFAGQKFPQKLLKKLIDDFGSAAPSIVVGNPYILLNYQRMGWKTVDGWALTSELIKYPHNGIERARAAIYEYLVQVRNDGHTWAPLIDLKSSMHRFTSLPLNGDALESLIADHIVTRDTTDTGMDSYALSYLHYAEKGIARHLVRLWLAGSPLRRAYGTTGLEEEQIPAAENLSNWPVAVLTGGAGTGKSTLTINILGSILDQSEGYDAIKVMAPTGKAAKRDAELIAQHLPDSGIVPTTIHSALAAAASDEPLGVPASSAKFGRGRAEFGFRHNEADTLPANHVVIEELSMCDAVLFNKALGACADGTRVLLVGDPNQLPSVQAGAVLRDLILAGWPTATLTKPRRNAGRIVHSCHAILRGDTPIPAPRFNLEIGDNYVHIEESDPNKIPDIIARLHDNPNRDPKRDIQVITAENYKKPIACRNLNDILSAKLNPRPNGGGIELPDGNGNGNGNGDDDEGGGVRFRPEDKVIRLENGSVAELIALDIGSNGDLADDYDSVTWDWQGRLYEVRETKVVNGDMGIVKDMVEDRYGFHVIVQFTNPNRLCRLPYATCELALAYAITVHKSQGSGFPYVILPVHQIFHKGLFSREFLYTAFSRAEQALVTVGTRESIALAVGRKTIHQRRTRLREFVAAEVAGWEREHDGRSLWSEPTRDRSEDDGEGYPGEEREAVDSGDSNGDNDGSGVAESAESFDDWDV